jgi:hypothetical protein
MNTDNVPVRYILNGKVIALHTDGGPHVPPAKYDVKQVLKVGPFHTWVAV